MALAGWPAFAQQSTDGTIAIADSLFQPIVLPSVLSFGYPPNTIHKPQIVEMIRRRDFDGLDALFGGLQADVNRDVRHEIRLGDAFDAVDRSEPALLASLDAWIAAKPTSAHALVARANYHLATAWRRRGRRYIRDTPPESIQGMRESAERAVGDVVAALERDSTHLQAYIIANAVLRMAGGHEVALQLMRRGLSLHPGSYALYRSYITMLWPRWGGTEALMVEFGERAARDSARNPRLVTLRGAVHESRAFDSTLAGNDAGAVRELNKAVAFGPERVYISARGKAYFRLGAYEYAFNDLRAAIVERSQDRDDLQYYGRTLVELATRARPASRPAILARATEILLLATYLDPSNVPARTALERARRMTGS